MELVLTMSALHQTKKDRLRCIVGSMLCYFYFNVCFFRGISVFSLPTYHESFLYSTARCASNPSHVCSSDSFSRDKTALSMVPR